MSRHLARAVVGLLLLTGTAFAQQPVVRAKIVATDHQAVKATITYEIKTTTFAPNRWLVYLAEPPELAGQTQVKVAAEPKSTVVAEDSPLARSVRFFDVSVPNPVPGGSLTVKQDIQATIRTRYLVPLGNGERPPKVAPLADAELKHYTAPGQSVDFDSKVFQDWLDKKALRAKKGEPPLGFAARVLEVIRADYTYQGVSQDQRSSVVCARATGDCASMSSLFVAAMRANQFPARTLVGRFTKPRAPGTDEYHPHVRAETFVAGIGWVPVEATYANSNKRKPVTAFIGYDPGDMIVLHVDADLRLQFLDKQTVCKALQGSPAYKTFGKGTFDGKYGPSGWDLKATPFEKKK